MTIAEQVSMWNKFIAMNEEYVVMLNESDFTELIDQPFVIEGEAIYSPCNCQEYIPEHKFRSYSHLFDNLILYSLTRLDPQQESLRMDRGER